MLDVQIKWLLIIAIPIACISWTFTHEEVFKEVHDYCLECSRKRRLLIIRKIFYLFTCEYCFSHYITIIFLAITDFRLLFADWRGYVISGFSLVWIANIYMSFYARFRVSLKSERAEAKIKEEVLRRAEDET